MMSSPAPPKTSSASVTAVEVVVAAVTPKGVHAAVAVDDVGAFGAAEHIVLAADDSEVAADIVACRRQRCCRCSHAPLSGRGSLP